MNASGGCRGGGGARQMLPLVEWAGVVTQWLHDKGSGSSSTGLHWCPSSGLPQLRERPDPAQNSWELSTSPAGPGPLPRQPVSSPAPCPGSLSPPLPLAQAACLLPCSSSTAWTLQICFSPPHRSWALTVTAFMEKFLGMFDWPDNTYWQHSSMLRVERDFANKISNIALCSCSCPNPPELT